MHKRHAKTLLSAIPFVFALILIIPATWQPPSQNQGPAMTVAPSGYIQRPPITITGDTALDAFCSGNGTNGTISNPHRLRNYYIDGQGALVSGIKLVDTTRYVVIENCTIINCGTTTFYAGVYLSNADHVNITRCEFTDDYMGIYLSGGSTANTVEYCHFQGEYPPTNYGIRSDGCSSNTYQYCVFDLYNTGMALCFHYNSGLNTIRGCTMNGASFYAYNNADGADSNKIYNNTFVGARNPIFMYRSSWNNITGNRFMDCFLTYDGIIDINTATNVTVAKNNITSNMGDPFSGIHLDGSSGAVIRENRIHGNQRGIFIEYGQYNRVYKNDFSGNTDDGLAYSSGTNWLDDGLNGNYWGDYVTNYPSALNNGIVWETPYTLASATIDRFPLVVPFVYQQNVNPPQLTSGQVSPSSAPMSTPFNFSVVYSDADNNHPSAIWVTVNGTQHPLVKRSTTDTNYVDGCQYQRSLYLQPGNYVYSFTASDPAYTDTTGTSSGPNVSIVNDFSPVLSDVFSYPMVGYEGLTTCWFKARYSDADNNAPVLVQITIDGGSTFPMIREDPADANYTDGTGFYFTTMLGLGPHNFTMRAFDASRNTTTAVTMGPIIKQNMDWDQIDLNGKRIGCVTTHGETNPITAYATFVTNYLRPRGVNVSVVSSALTAGVLANYDMLWVDDNGGTIPGAQLDALFAWLASGGRLFTSGALAPTSVASILARLNITEYDGSTGEVTSDFSPHPIVDGIGALKFQNIDGSRANLSRQPLAVPVVRVKGQVVVTAMAWGYGAIVDLRSYYFITTNYNQNDNLEFLQNVFGWLGYVNNHSPQLTGGKVTPATGSQNTPLNFSVTYVDPDDNTPLSVNLVVDGLSYPMTKVNAGDVTYKDGTTYQFFRYLQPGSHTFWFECSDTEFSNRTANLTVDITYTNGAPPTLEGPSVTPVYTNNILTTFTYSVTYRDNDNNMPAWINITIDGASHAMVMVDPLDYNAMDGVQYRYTTLLTWGTHQFNMSCSDGGTTIETPTYEAPELNPFGGSNVVLLDPPNGFNTYTGMTTFTWDSLELGIGPINYTIELSNTTTFVSIVQSQGGIPETPGSTSASVYLLQPTGTYYWRVRPVVNGAYGNATNYRTILITYNENRPMLTMNVVPAAGNQLTMFNFTTIYTDADNNAPAWLNVSINGIAHAMTKVDPGDVNYADGCQYHYQTLLPIGMSVFSFTTWDGKYANTTIPANVDVVRVNDYSPTLVNPQLSPASGTNTTTFTFSVYYFDQDNNLPVHINVTINGTGPGTGTFNMIKSSPADMNAVDGILYVLTWNVDWGMHEFIIRCYDDNRSADTGWLVGPSVNPFTGLAPTATTIFSDDFERASLGPDWTVSGTAGINTATHNSGTRAAFHSSDPGNVTTRVIDTSGFTSITVSFWVRKGFTAPGSDNPDSSSEDLFVEYYGLNGSWVRIMTYPGTDPAGTVYTVTNHTLPWNACHASFRIQFRQEGGSGLNQDYWHFDDVFVRSSPLYDLISPLQGQTAYSGTPAFTWQSLDLPLGAVNWTWQLSSDPAFSSILSQITGTVETPGTTNISPSLLFPTGNYAWRIRPEYKGIVHAWSDTVVFHLVYNENQPLLNGLVTPDPSNLTYVHNFTVTYTDADNNAPVFVSVTINGTQHVMAKVNTTDVTYSDGCLYFLEIALEEGYHSFQFNASDGKYAASTPLNTSLFVARINHFDPQLVNPQVTPTFGNDSAIYNFTVWYFDADNNLPLWVNLTIVGRGTYTVDPVDPSDTDATDGIFYRYSTMLSDGSYSFMFSCNDINRVNSTAWVPGPDVSPFRKPTITNVQVSPSTGTNATLFNFTATYTDMDNDLPLFVNITINATGTFPMAKVFPADNTAVDGILYQYVSTLAWGRYEFFVSCSDGLYTNTTLPQLGPVLNRVPSASFNANVSLSGAGDAVQFTFTGVEGDGPASFSWDFDDGSSNSSDRDPVHAFIAPGNYTVTLIVRDIDGEISSVSSTINIVSYPQLLQPSSLHLTFMQGTSGNFDLLLDDTTSGSGTFTITISGSPTGYTSVNWVNGVPASILANTTAPGTFLYDVTVENANGFTISKTITVLVDDYPAITSSSANLTIDARRGSLFLNWTVVDTVGAGTGSFIVYRNGARIENGTWISDELIAVLVSVNLPEGSYLFQIRVYFNGNTTWYVADSVLLIITTSQQGQQPQRSFIEDYWWVFLVAGIVALLGVMMGNRRMARSKKAKLRAKESKKQLPDVPVPTIATGKHPPGASMPEHMVGKVPQKLTGGKDASPDMADTSQERTFSARELQEIKATAEQVTTYKQTKICIVHKGPITGTIYVCPQCDSLYCMKCARVLKDSGQKCWACETQILKDEDEASDPHR